jgi:hypothetical protein
MRLFVRKSTVDVSISASVLQNHSLQAGLPAVLRRFTPEAYLKEWAETSYE